MKLSGSDIAFALAKVHTWEADRIARLLAAELGKRAAGGDAEAFRALRVMADAANAEEAKLTGTAVEDLARKRMAERYFQMTERGADAD